MLPTIHRNAYQHFLTVLISLRELVASSQAESDALGQGFRQVQQVFQTEILILSGEELEASIAPRFQSIQTEVYRSLRLLETDFLFWRTSRQAATSQQRLVVLENRLEALIGYCQAAIAPE